MASRRAFGVLLLLHISMATQPDYEPPLVQEYSNLYSMTRPQQWGYPVPMQWKHPLPGRSLVSYKETQKVWDPILRLTPRLSRVADPVDYAPTVYDHRRSQQWGQVNGFAWTRARPGLHIANVVRDGPPDVFDKQWLYPIVDRSIYARGPTRRSNDATESSSSDFSNSDKSLSLNIGILPSSAQKNLLSLLFDAKYSSNDGHTSNKVLRTKPHHSPKAYDKYPLDEVVERPGKCPYGWLPSIYGSCEPFNGIHREKYVIPVEPIRIRRDNSDFSVPPVWKKDTHGRSFKFCRSGMTLSGGLCRRM